MRGVERLEVEYLLSFVLGVSKSYIIAYPDISLIAAQQEKFDNLLARRRAGEPMAYLTGKQAFWDIELDVTPDVLIPRPETELLVEYILDNYNNKLRVLDLGTGSGAIAIALARARPDWDITAVDASEAALNIAKKNASKYRLDNIGFILSNWYSDIPPLATLATPYQRGLKNQRAFDIIVSNPPYIAENDRNLCQDVKNFEPTEALIAKNNGLADLDYIITHAPAFLMPGGLLIVEHGFEQAPAVREIFNNTGFIKVATLKDIQGHPRVTLGEISHLLI